MLCCRYAITLGSVGDYESLQVKITNGFKFKVSMLDFVGQWYYHWCTDGNTVKVTRCPTLELFKELFAVEDPATTKGIYLCSIACYLLEFWVAFFAYSEMKTTFRNLLTFEIMTIIFICIDSVQYFYVLPFTCPTGTHTESHRHRPPGLWGPLPPWALVLWGKLTTRHTS